MLTNTERQQIVEEVNAGTYGIDEALDDIAAAQKGEEVRKALYAEALVLNREGHAGSTDMIARQQIANLQTSVNGQISTLRTEVGDDIDDLETALNSGLATQNGKISAQDATIANVVANYNVEYGSTELWASTGETGALAAGTTVTLSEDVSHFDYIDIYSFCGNSNVLDTVPVDAKLQSSQGYALRWVNLSDPDSGSYKAYVRIIETRLHIIGTTLTIDHQVTYRNGEEVNISGAEITQSNRSTYMGELGIMKVVGRKITANTEIEDVRIGADGTEYNSAGQAVRAQVNDIKSAIPAIDTTLSVAGAAADAKKVGDKLTNVKEDLSNLQSASVCDLIEYANHSTMTSCGITYTYDGNNTWTVNGTVDGTSFYPLFSSKSTTAPFEAGNTYNIWFESSSERISLQVYKWVGSTLSYAETVDSKAEFQSVTIPSDATGILMRFRTFASVSNAAVTCWVYEDSIVFDKIGMIDQAIDSKVGFVTAVGHTVDLDTVTAVGVYSYSNSSKPVNAPTEESNAVLTVLHGFGLQGFLVQLCSTFSGKLFQRLQYTNGTWTAWSEISKGGTTIQNTYNITTSPTITTDSNGWLQAVDTDSADETGKTDMTGPIMSMLTDTGYCHLGEGIFYVSGNIDMPEGSTLCGCGKKTVVRLLQSTTTGYCVKIGKYCTIKDISFEGARSFSMPSTKGTRNGIAFMANYDASPSVTTNHCMISNVWCKYFSGAGIYCHNTSINYAKGVYVSNAFIDTCYAGIDIDYYSEFNKFTNVCTSWCKFGCVNNGGNNVFTACTFHATDTGFYIDGTQPNNAHGTMTGCTFCHIGSNAGKAIDIKNTANGFIIDSCQIWYNSINIENSSGIVISNCELGRGTTGAGATIVVTGGNTVMFVGCVFMNDENYVPDINITDNTKVKFVNCYGSVSGNLITA